MGNKPFKAELLHRQRIDKILKGIFEVPLFVLQSSMGYGKTTAVKQFLSFQGNINYSWFSLNTDEDDETWMWQKFCQSLEVLNNDLAKRLSQHGLPRTHVNRERIIDVFRTGLTYPLVLVIDDYHENKSVQMDQLITAIARAGLKNLHIVLSSRIRPNIPLEELELKGFCRLLTQDKFEFNKKEIAQLFIENGFYLTTTELDILYESTEGWIAAIYLSLIKYAMSHKVDSYRNVARLIKNAVYDRFDRDIQTILLKLSLLEQFDLEGAIYITGNPKAGEVIYELAANHCFIRYDPADGTYVIHAILKAMLQELFVLSDLEKANLLDRCGDWCMKSKKPIEAITFYHAAQSHDKILDMFERKGSTVYFNQAPQIMIRAFNDIPKEKKIARPYAYLTYIYIYLVRHNDEEGAKMFYEAKGIYEIDQALEDRNKILGEITLIESFLQYNDMSKMIEHQKLTYSLFDGSVSRISYPSAIVTFGSPHALFLYHKEKGNLLREVEMIEENMKYYIAVTNGGGTGCEYTARAEYYLETGVLGKAEQFASKAIYKALTKNQISLIICSKLCLARIAILRGNPDKAYEILEELKAQVDASGSRILLDSYDIASGYLYGILGNLEKIPQWLREGDLSQCSLFKQGIGVNYIVIGRGAILRRSYTELEVIVETMQEVYRPYNQIFGLIYAGIYDAIAKYNLHNPRMAVASLHQAIDMAQADGIVTPFAENLPDLIPILRERSSLPQSVWLRTVFRLGKVLTKDSKGIGQLYNTLENKDVHLSKREIDVLNLLNEGYRQTEIAEELCLSQNTVRRHLQNAYKKLDVSNKVLALRKAKDLNILN